MLVSEAISRISYALRGIDDDAPVSGSDEYSYWLSTLNRKKDELYSNVTTNWSNTYEVREAGTVVASTDPIELGEDFLAASDVAYVIDADGHRHDFRITNPDERVIGRREVFIAGMNPQGLYFTNEVESGEQIVGGTLYLPGYYMPADVTEATDPIPFLDPNWAVMATASEIAFNDIIYETKAPDLNDKANALLRQMIARNRRGTYANPRKVPTVVNRIRGARR